MLRKLMAPALAATLLVAACDAPTSSTSAAQDADDYALVMFGEIGGSLEGTMGPQGGSGPFDGASAGLRLPDSLALSSEQRATIASFRAAFREAHEGELAALRTIFQAARAAKNAGASRDEVRAILQQGREIAQGLRPALEQLHQDLWSVLTDAQKVWVLANRPPRWPRPIAP